MDQERQLKEEIEKVSGGEGEPTPRMNKLPTKVLLILGEKLYAEYPENNRE